MVGRDFVTGGRFVYSYRPVSYRLIRGAGSTVPGSRDFASLTNFCGVVNSGAEYGVLFTLGRGSVYIYSLTGILSVAGSSVSRRLGGVGRTNIIGYRGYNGRIFCSLSSRRIFRVFSLDVARVGRENGWGVGDRGGVLMTFVLGLAFSMFRLINNVFAGDITVVSSSVRSLKSTMDVNVSCFLRGGDGGRPSRACACKCLECSIVNDIVAALVLVINSILIAMGTMGHVVGPSRVGCGNVVVFTIVNIIMGFLTTCFAGSKSSLGRGSIGLRVLRSILK